MKRMPAVFLGHGNPMIALADNELTRRFRTLGERIVAGFGRPKAILAVSAHWYNARTFVQTDSEPRQVYDMTGFPKELYELKYPGPRQRGAERPRAGRAQVEARRDDAVIDYRRHEDAAYAVPSPDHFLPLLYALGASAGEKPCAFNAVRTLAAISMTSYAFGMDA